MDGYDFEKLAREIVGGKLVGLAERAPETAAEIAKRILVSALKSTRLRQDPRVTVTGVCRGVLGGLMLINQDLSSAAPLILKEMGHVAHEVPISTEDLMTWGMEGFAEVMKLAGSDVEHAVEQRIEESFMGAGTVFHQACERVRSGAA